MKKISKIISALALSAALSMGAATVAFADVVFADYELSIAGTGDYTATDLFDNFKNVMPGDELDQSVTVTNSNPLKVNVYLRAEAHDEESNPLTIGTSDEGHEGEDLPSSQEPSDVVPMADEADQSGQAGETVASIQDFLSQLHMTVTVGDRVVFDAQPHLEAGLSENVLLGELRPGETMTVNAHLAVPIELSDKYANRSGEVDWVFVVEELDPVLPDTGGQLPATGDTVPIALIAVTAVAAFAIIVLLVAVRRRNNDC